MFGRQPTDPFVGVEKEKIQLSKQDSLINAAMYTDQQYSEDRDARDDLTRWQQNINPELIEFYYELLSYYRDVDGNYKPKQMPVWDSQAGAMVLKQMPPLINTMGASTILMLLKQYSSRNFMNSNYDEKKINNISRQFGWELNWALGGKYDIYQIDMFQFSIIVNMAEDIMHSTMLRALNDGERKHQETQRKFIETYANKGEEKKGMFGGLF
jgi:hypothetical protein